MLSTRQSITLFTTGLLAATLGSSVVHAETSCKGLVVDECGNQAACLWVRGYTRKDGKAVGGYCRSKGGKSKGMTEKGASADRADSVSRQARQAHSITVEKTQHDG
jgi:hypothetical protein